MEQMETAAEAKAARGPKATIRREMTRVHTPATATGNIGADAARSIMSGLRVCQYSVSAVLLCRVHNMAVVSCKLQYPTSACLMVGFVTIAGRRGRQGYQGGRAFSMLPSCCGHAAGAPAGAARGGVRLARSRRHSGCPLWVCIPGCGSWAVLCRRGAGRCGSRQPERPPGAGAAPYVLQHGCRKWRLIASGHCKLSLFIREALWGALIACAAEYCCLAGPSGLPQYQHARNSWTQGLGACHGELKQVSCWGMKQSLAGAAWPRCRRPSWPWTAARADGLVPIVPLSAARACAQVAPREVLFARNRLSGPTMRCLASPLIPLMLSPVEPGAEFPDAQDMGAFQEGMQARPPVGPGSTACAGGNLSGRSAGCCPA